METRAAFAGSLLDWYAQNRRDLPWRHLQDDPYAVWVAEIMLQQTQVATVIPYFERWMRRFPTVKALAQAPLEEVLHGWSGLGYYARARNLHRAAQAVMEHYGGNLPSDPAILASLPGIGRYTAGAICSIAFHQPAPLVDTNVARVLTRVFAIGGDPKSGPVQSRLWHLAKELIPEGRARDFNQALMELGALVCTPSDPTCERCPLLRICIAGNSPDPTAWPQIPPGRATVRVTHCSAVLHEDNRLLIVQRPPHGLWGGLWEFPRRVCRHGEPPAECAARAAQEILGVKARIGEKVSTVKHNVTHHTMTLFGFEGRILEGEPQVCDCAAFRWMSVEEIAQLPLSSPQSRLVAGIRRWMEGEPQLRLL
ncbi:MAG TPA: A/G-specific adenine glycosylase [Chthonomonadales bacterium]|nr:A/G-specific adenine glycosylase [Chthonomonadales bacterium]